MLDIVTHTYDQINNNHYTCMELLDCKKAFDTAAIKYYCKN